MRLIARTALLARPRRAIRSRGPARSAAPPGADDRARGAAGVDRDRRGAANPRAVPGAPRVVRSQAVPGALFRAGSASPELLRQSSESLAGRIRFVELHGLTLGEVGTNHLRKRLVRGGFPRAWGDAPTLTKSMRVALDGLGLSALYIVYPGPKRYALARDVEVLPIRELASVLPRGSKSR